MLFVGVKLMAAMGFEPTPEKKLVPLTSALDHSATALYRILDS